MAATFGDIPGVGESSAALAADGTSKAHGVGCVNTSNTLKPAPDAREKAIFSKPSTGSNTAVKASCVVDSGKQAVIDNGNVQKASVIDNGESAKNAAKARERINELKEEFRWRPGHEDWRARWWRGLTVDEKRMVCALCGVDDSADSVKRSWPSLPYSVRESVSKQCRHWARVLEAMRWA